MKLDPSRQHVEKLGFWGQPTATIDWCEENYVVSHYVAEFWNTVSSFVLTACSIYGMCQAIRYRMETRIFACYLGLFGVGFGTCLFHTTLKYEMQLLDELPMIFGAAINVYALSQVEKRRGEHSALMMLILASFCFVVVVTYLISNEPVFHEIMFGVLVVIDALLCYQQARLFPKSLNFMVATGVLMFMTGFAVWLCDNRFCAELSRFRSDSQGLGIVGTFVAPLTQFHAVWHVLSGYAAYMQVLLITFARQKHLESQEGCEHSCKVSCFRVVVHQTNMNGNVKKCY